jgi:L-fuculose-phosphate aldolase
VDARETTEIETRRRELAASCRRLAAAGLVLGTSGNASVRVGERVMVTPTGGVLAELEPEHATIVDLDGTVTEGQLQPTSELELHLGIYERFGAGAVVHTHAPMATALSCVLDELPMVHYQMLAFGGPVRVAPYATFGSPELARAVHAALEGRTAALMQNHGAVCHGPDLASATESALLLEWACGVYWHARAIDAPRVLSERELGDVLAMVQRRSYGRLQQR